MRIFLVRRAPYFLVRHWGDGINFRAIQCFLAQSGQPKFDEGGLCWRLLPPNTVSFFRGSLSRHGFAHVAVALWEPLGFLFMRPVEECYHVGKCPAYNRIVSWKWGAQK